MNSILIATHALAFLFGGMLVALAWHANTRDTRQPKQEPPAGFDSDPMMESDDRPFRSVGHLFGRYGHFGTPIVGTAVVPEPSANPLPNSGYPLTHEETEAMLAECPPKSAPAGTGVNSPKTDTGD